MTPITICDQVVDAGEIVETLVAKVAELTLENAVLRCQVRLYAGLATAHVVEGAPAPDRASEGPTDVSPEVVEPGPEPVVPDLP